MEDLTMPCPGDKVFLHKEGDNEGVFFSVIDVNGDVMAVQACSICEGHLKETDSLNVVVLKYNRKQNEWIWKNGPETFVATLLK